MIWTLFFYNSLPDIPMGCRLVSREIMHRDFFECNPHNTGHFEYPKFETLSYDTGCHEREVTTFLDKTDPEKYVIFYTRHTSLKGESQNKIIGYFKVGKTFKLEKKGFYASESILLPKDQCYPINYHSRGVPVSWGYSSVKEECNQLLNQMRTMQSINIAVRYQEETKSIMKELKKANGRKRIIEVCSSCPEKIECFWGRMKNKEGLLNELYSRELGC